MLRKLLLLLIALQGAGLLIWFGVLRPRNRPGVDWLAVAGCVAFFTCLALLSHNWRRQDREDDEARGFEVLPHDKDTP